MSRLIRIVIVFVLVVSGGVFAQDTSLPSKKTLYQRARETLMQSLMQGDMERAGQAIDYLKENVENGAPFTIAEEYIADMKVGRYVDGIRIYADICRYNLDTTYFGSQKNRASVDDGLTLYLFHDLIPFTKHVADSLLAVVESSNIEQEYKDLYRVHLYSEQVFISRPLTIGPRNVVVLDVKDTSYAEEFIQVANSFIEAYPHSEHAVYLKEQTVPFLQKHLDLYREFRKDPFARKYYSGGLAFYASKWTGFMTGDATDYLDYKLGSTFIFELQLQMWRIILGYYVYGGVDTQLKDHYSDPDYSWCECYESQNSYGFTLGFDVFDRRFIKVAPFIGIGGGSLMDDVYKYGVIYSFGLNLDVPVVVTKPLFPGALSVGVHLRLKYMAQMGLMSNKAYVYAVENPYKDEIDFLPRDLYSSAERRKLGDTFTQMFSIGLGFFLW